MRATITDLAALLLVVAASAVVLRVADAVPQVLTGLPRGVTRAASLGDLARAQDRPVVLPTYYPSDLEWPPGDLLCAGPNARALTARQGATGAAWLTIASAPSEATLAAARLVPAVTVLQDTETRLGNLTARVQRLQDASGAIWHQAAWHAAARYHLVRYRGSLDDLMRIAASYHPRPTS